MINAAPDGHQKLIIFADSRQEAAFQAGWMQDHARRIRLRHMMFRVVSESTEPLSLDAITDQLTAVFRKDRNLIETLLPELTGEEAQAIFGHNLQVSIHKALRYMVLREFTTGVRRTDCLESMGLASVSYRGLSSSSNTLMAWANMLGISPDEAVHAITLVLDIWRRNRIMFVANDPVFSHFHAKDDPYIQAGLLPLREFRPEGLLLTTASEDKYARGILAQRGASAVQALIKKWAKDPEHVDTDAAATMLWEHLTKQTGILAQVTLRSSKDKPLQRDVWQVNAERVQVERSAQRVRCTTCQRIMTRSAPQSACTQHNCRGTTVSEAPDQDNYDVALMQRPFVMVAAEEHTAQVPGETRLAIEQDFKSRKGRTNCLVATPTLEMGVNIGALDMALMRNVPPRCSNYWQRAGRAGREERMAVVVTYCQRSQHDRYFFDDPLRLLGGAIEAPAFNLRNPLMVEKHIRSAILSELVLRGHGAGSDAETTLDALKVLFPTFIRDYLLDEEDHFRDAPTSIAPLAELLASNETEFCDRLVALFAQHWPPEAQELADRPAIQRTLRETAQALDAVLHRLHRRLDWARRTRAELHRKKDAGLIARDEEQLLRRCEEFINRIVRRDRSTYGLTVLGAEGFLPGYGIYEGGITASARRGFAQHGGPRSFDLSRSNVVALREFVPGNRLYANRGTFYVARYHLGAEETSALRTLRFDADKGFVTDHAGSAAYGQTGGVVLDALPITDLDLAHESRISEDEQLRFAMPVLTLGRLRRRNRGGHAFKLGDQEVLHLRGQGIELVNVGEAARVKAGEFGHLICSVCGAAKTPYAVTAEINHFMKVHKERCGKEPVRLALTAEANVDALQFVGVGSQQRAVNIGESLRTAATRLLDMGEEDLQLLIVQKADETTDLLLYDPMPGGSGLLEQMLARWRELIAMARSVLTDCAMQCEAGCYACLKTYRNQFYHELLNRHDAAENLLDLDHDPANYRSLPPVFEEEGTDTGAPSNPPEARLHRILREHHFPPGKCREPVRTTAGLQSVSRGLLEAVAVELPAAKPQARTTARSTPANRQYERRTPELVRAAIERTGTRVTSEKRKGTSTYLYCDRDPCNPEIQAGNATDIAVMVGDDGWVGFKDWHARGQGNNNQETILRALGLWNEPRDTSRNAQDNTDRDGEPAEPEHAPLTVLELLERYPRLRPPLLEGLLREGETANIIAASKVGKSWLSLALAICKATGRTWLDQFGTIPGRVLYIDNELHPETIAARIKRVAEAMGVRLADFQDEVQVETLRGRLLPIGPLARWVKRQAADVSLVVLDALYRTLPEGASENDNAAMASVFNIIDNLAADTGAGVVLIHHATKGDQSMKGVTDIGAGAGALSRAADSHIVLRPHEDPTAVVLEAAVRSWPHVEPLALRWEFPLWKPAPELDPTCLKSTRPPRRSQPKTNETKAKPEPWTPEQFVSTFVSDKPTTRSDIRSKLSQHPGLKWRAVDDLMNVAEDKRLIVRVKLGGRGGREGFVVAGSQLTLEQQKETTA